MTLNIASRNDIGELFCKGEGLEIGAGCLPTSVAKGSVIHFADKRTPDELRTYFSTNDIVNVQSLSVFEGQEFDFVIAHHVLEHSANVIQTLIHWISFVKDGGILFLSLPNRHITPDASRLLTPPTHFLLDYAYQITEDDYESREHICSFLWGWIDVGGLEGKSK
ncbi:Methyltransferase domain-containing protein, partial [Trichlorobacter thiogenes]